MHPILKAYNDIINLDKFTTDTICDKCVYFVPKKQYMEGIPVSFPNYCSVINSNDSTLVEKCPCRKCLLISSCSQSCQEKKNYILKVLTICMKRVENKIEEEK